MTAGVRAGRRGDQASTTSPDTRTNGLDHPARDSRDVMAAWFRRIQGVRQPLCDVPEDLRRDRRRHGPLLWFYVTSLAILIGAQLTRRSALHDRPAPAWCKARARRRVPRPSGPHGPRAPADNVGSAAQQDKDESQSSDLGCWDAGRRNGGGGPPGRLRRHAAKLAMLLESSVTAPVRAKALPIRFARY